MFTLDRLRRATALVQNAASDGRTLKVLGGVAVYLRCRRILEEVRELERSTGDIDLVGLRHERQALERFFWRQDLVACRELNVISGGDRLYYVDSAEGGGRSRVDVVLDQLSMCHVLELTDRLDQHPLTIPATDLLLSKLQVVFPSERDVKDTLALLATFGFEPTEDDPDFLELKYICRLCGRDWGWHHTVMLNLGRVDDWAQRIEDEGVRSRVRQRARTLMKALTDCPKTWRWRLRDLVGERVRWYRIPEEVEVA